MDKKIKRMPKTKTFNGRRYELVGSTPTKRKSLADSWADYNRRFNNVLVRVVKAPYPGYELYIRRK